MPSLRVALPKIAKMRKFNVNFLLNEEPSLNILDLRPGKASRAQQASHAVSSISKYGMNAVKRGAQYTYDRVTRGTK